MTKSYKELKDELDEVMAWFEQDNIDIDKALEKHAHAEKLIRELRVYLEKTEQKIRKIKPQY